MRSRLVMVLCVLAIAAGCSSLDDNNTPYEGLSPDEIPAAPGAGASTYSGYYTGTMTVDANTCQSVSDEVGASIDLAFDVAQSDTIINVTFEDGAVSAATLATDAATVVVQDRGVKHAYALTFAADGTVTGTCEVIEADVGGQLFGKPCANYTISLAKGEKTMEDVAAPKNP